MKSLWFVVPVHGRLALSAICLRQLRRTCDSLVENGIDATAVVVSDRDELEELELRLGEELLGFGCVERDNRFLGRRFNDGIQLATDRRFNRRPADYVVPIGSDDWVDYRLFLELPAHDVMIGFQRISFVREDGRELTTRFLNYRGGCGIRIYSRPTMARRGFRPAEEDRRRGCDTSILTNLERSHRFLSVEHRELDPRQIVDWKSPGENLNPYEKLARHALETAGNPFEVLAGVYPAEALEEMEAHYERAEELAVA